MVNNTESMIFKIGLRITSSVLNTESMIFKIGLRITSSVLFI